MKDQYSVENSKSSGTNGHSIQRVWASTFGYYPLPGTEAEKFCEQVELMTDQLLQAERRATTKKGYQAGYQDALMNFPPKYKQDKDRPKFTIPKPKLKGGQDE